MPATRGVTTSGAAADAGADALVAPDTVTDKRVVKLVFEQGIGAMKGIEY